MYRIAVSPPRLLQSTIWGFLDVPEVLEYADHMVATHSKFCRFSTTYRLVIDASGAKIQSQDVLGAIAKHISTFPPAERVGVVVGRSLNKYQALRLMDRPHVRFADEIDEAQRWAFDEIVPRTMLNVIIEGGRGK